MADTKENGAHPDVLNSLFGLGTKRKKKRNLEWASDLPECEIGDFLIVPLTTSRQLRAEGRAMKHCAGQYDELCHQGLARVFSIRDLSGNRVATASLIWLDDYWHLEQVKGYENAEVQESEETFYNGNSTVTQLEPTELYFVGQEFLQRYRSAWSDRLHNCVCKLI
jgi:hypothetical protein